MAVCNLFMQHPYSHEMATAHWGTYKKYIINNSNSVHVYNLRKQSGTRFKCRSAIPCDPKSCQQFLWSCWLWCEITGHSIETYIPIQVLMNSMNMNNSWIQAA
jgi:hypothetical protein